MSSAKQENFLLGRWKMIVGILMAIVTPSVTATSAYWKLKNEAIVEHAQVDARISSVELTAQKSFAEKQDLKEMQNTINDMHDDISEIKVLLRTRR